MREALKMLLSRVLDGRPMTRVGFAFTDTVVNEPVYYYRDTFGRLWMAQGAWARFRVGVQSWGGTPDA